MTQRWFIVVGCAVAAVLAVACDPAKSDYEHCLELEKLGKLEDAAKACEAAMQKDPSGASGQAAREKLGKLQVKVVDDLAGKLEQNNECTKAQLALIDAKPEDKARLTTERDAKCKDVLPSSSAK